MPILNEFQLESNNKIKINFDGGDLSSDSGLFLIEEFAQKVDFQKLISNIFKTNDTAMYRFHTDTDNLMQEIYQTIAEYFRDDNADELDQLTVKNKIDYAVCYGEFQYQAGSWKYPRRVVVKVEKPANQMTYLYTFIVTNMEPSPENMIKLYYNRR